MHREAIGPYLELRNAARAGGFDLSILSGFRSFEEQLSIWNRKASGKLAVLGSDARPLDITTLSDKELVFAILRWSALPGASRHHWGTDVDIYDMAARPVGYEVQLIPGEVEAGGMFAPLHEWLDRRIANKTASGFFRPYDIDRNGVAPERWHLSYGPLAAEYMQTLTRDLLAQTIRQADMLLKDVVLDQLDAIYERFVINTNRALGSI
jgi:LAS superfamily LD-carboxypeptidase LdcB